MIKKSQVWIIFFLLIFALTACQANQEEVGEEETIYLPQSSSGSNDQGYPIQDEVNPQDDDSYPIQNEPIPQPEEAYPVSSTDLQLLNRGWFLVGYQKGGDTMDPASKTMVFFGDTFEITTEEGTVMGQWSARIDSPNPILVMDTENEGTLFYEIITLNETNLILRTAQDQIQVLEEYMPVD